MEFGVHLPLIDFGGTRQDLDYLRSYARTASQAGFTYLCANDHLVFGRPWLDGPTALAAVVGDSGEMTLATTVAVPVLRGPIATAKAMAAIDRLSNGRLVVGVGPGSSPRDYALLGIPFEERWKRLEESIHAMRAVWESGSPGYEGHFYTTAGESLEPFPAQQPGPPVWLGSWGSAAGLRRVARIGDGWLASGYNTDPERFATALNDLRDHLAAAGKDADRFPNGIATMWTYITPDRSKAERMLRDVLAPMLGRDVDELRQLLPIGGPDECAETLASYRDAGAQRVFLWPIDDELEQLEIFQAQVAPLI